MSLNLFDIEKIKIGTLLRNTKWRPFSSIVICLLLEILCKYFTLYPYIWWDLCSTYKQLTTFQISSKQYFLVLISGGTNSKYSNFEHPNFDIFELRTWRTSVLNSKTNSNFQCRTSNSEKYKKTLIFCINFFTLLFIEIF